MRFAPAGPSKSSTFSRRCSAPPSARRACVTWWAPGGSPATTGQAAECRPRLRPSLSRWVARLCGAKLKPPKAFTFSSRSGLAAFLSTLSAWVRPLDTASAASRFHVPQTVCAGKRSTPVHLSTIPCTMPPPRLLCRPPALLSSEHGVQGRYPGHRCIL